LDRQEAVALLRELIAANLAQPSLISIDKIKNNTFSITMKGDTNLLGLRAFLADKDLVLRENKENGTCTIYRL
jgi:hypothetical protein